MRVDVFYDLRPGSPGLMRDTGQGIEGGRMAKSLFREAENHDGRCSQGIYDDLAGVRNAGLKAVAFQHVQAAGGQDIVDHRQLSGMHHIAFAATEPGQGRFGDIVFGGAQPARCNDDGILL